MNRYDIDADMNRYDIDADMNRYDFDAEGICFRSRTPRRYCHLITLVTSVYRKTNVFLTTVGTATPPGGKMGE
jgi:hypothetical protein